MIEQIRLLHKETQLFFDKSQEYLMYELSRESTIIKTEPHSQGTICYATLTPDQLHKWKDYLVRLKS